MRSLDDESGVQGDANGILALSFNAKKVANTKVTPSFYFPT